MRAIRFLLAIILTGWVVQSAPAALKVYYLRHAQTGANAVKYFKDVPHDERPAYVGNANTFSPKGEEQAADVPRKLAPYHFDFIAVSPLWRTRHTILPYLQAQQRSVVIWPELAEFGGRDGDLSLIGTDGLPPARAELLKGGRKIVIPAEEQRWFTLPDTSQTKPHLGRGGAEGAADLTALEQLVIDRVRQEFGGTDKSILLVGHGNAGKYLLSLLTGEHWVVDRGLDNTGLWMAEEQADGSFKLVMGDGKILAEMPELEAFKHPVR
ncbi:MAG: histidine phosphatase family protein [Opitutaceae bacterium]|nr:histidine phosphatase family protein [Opitutaceae bacterium]